MPPFRFVVFIGVSLVAFILVLYWSLRRRAVQPARWKIAVISFVIVVVGMLFAKVGANAGLSPLIYYGVPALTTLLLPLIAFRMSAGEYAQYAILAFATSPIIHVLFSLAGWHEYLPFWHVPSFADLSAGA